jgi:hypothetical protein
MIVRQIKGKLKSSGTARKKQETAAALSRQ